MKWIWIVGIIVINIIILLIYTIIILGLQTHKKERVIWN